MCTHAPLYGSRDVHFFWTASARDLSPRAEMAEKCTFLGYLPHATLRMRRGGLRRVRKLTPHSLEIYTVATHCACTGFHVYQVICIQYAY